MADDDKTYVLDDQVGFVLRRVVQRHLTIFGDHIPQVTNMQFAVLVRLHQSGPQSQNHLGRAAAMDAATVKGVVGRLEAMALVERRADPDDRRRLTVALTDAGQALIEGLYGKGHAVTAETLAPLNAEERQQLLALLSRLA
ncbi:MarR family winged helix-turn-helix transcriptional regulator [Gemmobacter denitrificans]|uniref:MarR family transcriptional regulator n=1 Tax=Gemmobacter denitrificans TaxID=3123040 RepID=A0ABU8BXA1_9RHOB